MKIKKSYIIIVVVLLIILVGSLEAISKLKGFIVNKPKIEINTDSKVEFSNSQIELLHTLVGLESKNMKILDNPLSIEGIYEVPEGTVLSYIEYFLKTSKNKDIQDIEVNIDEESLSINAKYKLLNTFKTPIDISIVPSLTKSSQVKLHIKDIKVLGLSIDEELIDTIVDSWFSNMEGISVSKGDVIMDKDIFKGVSVKSISLNSSNLSMGLSIKLE
ncbi:MAG: hypothetical protein RR712_04270 [Terrisporobacter sp.]